MTDAVKKARTTGPDQRLPVTVTRTELLIEGSDAQFRQLIHRLLAYASSLEAIRAGLGEMIGLSGTQYTILICIAHLQQGKAVGVKEIAFHLSYTGALVTIETGKLVKLGLVEKRQNPADKRRVLLTITGRTRELLRGLAPSQRQVNDTLFANLSAEGFGQLCTLTESLCADARTAQSLVEFLIGTQVANQNGL